MQSPGFGAPTSDHRTRWVRYLGARAWSGVVRRALPHRLTRFVDDRGVPRGAWVVTGALLVGGALAGFGPLGAQPTAQALRDGGPADGRGLDDLVGTLVVNVPRRDLPEAVAPATKSSGRRARRSVAKPASGGGALAPATTDTAPRLPQPAPRALVPAGKGMWIYVWPRTEGGNPAAVVSRAKAAGVSNVYVRLGSTKDGFTTQGVLDALLPAAHAAGIKVVGWDFPELHDPGADVARAVAMIRYRTAGGEGIDAFSADIETRSEGTNLRADYARAYGSWLRENTGPLVPLIATVPRPNGSGYPYAEVVENFDAIAPMVYWMQRDPVADVNAAIDALAAFGKPIIPVGQAYDGGPEGGPPGPPPKDALDRFMAAAAAKGALGVSFWVWQQATPEHWAAVTDAKSWDLPRMSPGPADAARVAFLQRILASLGYTVAPDGRYGESTGAAVAAFQQRVGLTPTGSLDASTIAKLLRH
jgi:hypothetical protein